MDALLVRVEHHINNPKRPHNYSQNDGILEVPSLTLVRTFTFDISNSIATIGGAITNNINKVLMLLSIDSVPLP